MSEAETTATLASVFDCTEGSAQALAGAMSAQSYTSKSILLHQGDVPNDLWLITQGSVQLQAVSFEGQVTVLAAFGPGELLGSFDPKHESAFDARASGRVEALQIDASQLRRLTGDHADIGSGVSRIYSNQLQSVIDRLSTRVTLSATGRLYRELLRLAGDKDEISPSPVVSALALTAQTTRETGSRAISVLERRGIIERDEHRLRIISRRMLEDLVI